MKKLSMINEHLWSGIIKRSETGDLRKEDSYMSEIVDYLNNHYEYHPYGYNDKKKIIETSSGDYFLSRIDLFIHEAFVESVEIFYHSEKSRGYPDDKYVISVFPQYQKTHNDVFINKVNELANEFNGSVDNDYVIFLFNVKNDETVYNFLDKVIELFSIKKSLIKIKP
jgi:hypothetical protein